MLPPLRAAALALSAASLLGCAAAPAASRLDRRGSGPPAPAALAPPPLALRSAAPPALAEPPLAEPPLAGPAPLLDAPPCAPARLARGAARIPLPAGRSLVEVEIPAGAFVSIVVLGAPDALLGFDIVGPAPLRPLRAHGPLDEDGRLPRAVSFRAPDGIDAIELLVDVREPVELARAAAPAPAAPALAPPAPSPGAAALLPRRPAPVDLPLIGLPAPLSREDGYLLQSPARYQFLRVDIARALLGALRQTRRRFRRDPIAIADISQWDGRRPATDLGAPRHISHEGGRDVDLALPALPAEDGEPSTVRAHCAGVLMEPDIHVCAPGTAFGVDTLRLAYFLALLIDGSPAGTVTTIFTDGVYVREIRSAIPILEQRRWIQRAAIEALRDDRVLRPSPWHTDHLHVRFGGAPARTSM